MRSGSASQSSKVAKSRAGELLTNRFSSGGKVSGLLAGANQLRNTGSAALARARGYAQEAKWAS
jgi:hypothetical protein